MIVKGCDKCGKTNQHDDRHWPHFEIYVDENFNKDRNSFGFHLCPDCDTRFRELIDDFVPRSQRIETRKKMIYQAGSQDE